MCGICGKVSARRVDIDQILAMTHSLAHRGPDDEGVYVGDGVGLGFRRLSIIDLEGGAQPMASGDGSVHIVFNGEIYNYRALRKDLQDDGFEFRTHSDTETILNAYLRDGVDCLSHLRGMFAFAIWDARIKRLFLARDRLGQKPLYYAQAGNDFYFGSEIKALLTADNSLAELDLAALDEYLTVRVIAAPRSMFSGIKKLAPAHYLTFDAAQGVEVKRYWDLSYEPKLKGDPEELLEELERKLVETIRIHLESDVPVGAFLSGGMDSTLIVALLASHGLAEGLQTFSVSLPLGRFDEAPLARLVAEKYGTHHREEVIQPSLVRDLPRLVAQLDEPSDSLAACMDLVARMASREVKVVLGGDGGDELFGGYDRYLGNQLADHYARIPTVVRDKLIGPILSRVPDGQWYKSLGHQLKWLHRLSASSGGRRYVESLSYFYYDGTHKPLLYGPRLTDLFGRLDPGAVMRTAYDQAPASTALDRMLYADLQSRLPDHPVMIQDRMTMAHGLEGRSPLMDHELAEFAAKLPTTLKIRGRTLRYAQVRLAQRYLPKELLSRKKQGFASALPVLLRDELDLLYRAFLQDAHLARAGFLNQSYVSTLVDTHRAGAADHGTRLWLALNAEVWYRMFIEGESGGRIQDCIARSMHDLGTPAGAGA
ncbi:MAG: asparagine synthase (glutamine-hydrolyzing) [Gemmatimonadetes bacterium]|nr:asparagine synthase (glutamine-hydrolyzing) [Gemmatimonadota bacterium]